MVAVLVTHDLLGRRAVPRGLAERDHLIARVASERPEAAQILYFGERGDVRREACELGPMGEPCDELRPLLGRLDRERVRDEDVDDLPGGGRDRAAPPSDRCARSTVERGGSGLAIEGASRSILRRSLCGEGLRAGRRAELGDASEDDSGGSGGGEQAQKRHRIVIAAHL